MSMTNGKDVLLVRITGDDNFNERSDYTKELISRKPSALERWALPIFLSIIIILFLSTGFIHYSDYVIGDATLLSQNSPKQLICKRDGYLTKLFVKNSSFVTKGQVIGWVESTGSHEQILSLSKKLDQSLKLLALNKFTNISNGFSGYNQLGELQTYYQQFIIAVEDFDDYLVNGFYEKKALTLRRDIETLRLIVDRLNKQRKLTSSQDVLAAKSFEMNKKLYDQKIITEEEFRQIQNAFLNKQKTLPQLDISLMEYDKQINEKEAEISQLSHNLTQQKQKFEQSIRSLASIVDDWLKKYLIVAPLAGRIFFTSPIEQGIFLKEGESLGYVDPQSSQGYFVEVTLPQKNFGKIDLNSEVQIRLDAYPYQEVGYVSGKVVFVPRIISEKGVLIKVKLIHGLITNRNQIILYKDHLTGQALIVTKRSTLMHRLYNNAINADFLNNKVKR